MNMSEILRTARDQINHVVSRMEMKTMLVTKLNQEDEDFLLKESIDDDGIFEIFPINPWHAAWQTAVETEIYNE